MWNESLYWVPENIEVDWILVANFLKVSEVKMACCDTMRIGRPTFIQILQKLHLVKILDQIDSNILALRSVLKVESGFCDTIGVSRNLGQM